MNSDVIEAIKAKLDILGYYDRIEVNYALEIILRYSKEPGVNLSDVHQLLQDIIEI